jgi:hypothetical protein
LKIIQYLYYHNTRYYRVMECRVPGNRVPEIGPWPPFGPFGEQPCAGERTIKPPPSKPARQSDRSSPPSSKSARRSGRQSPRRATWRDKDPMTHVNYHRMHHHQATSGRTRSTPNGCQEVAIDTTERPHKWSQVYPHCLVNPSHGGPQHRSLYNDPYIGKDGTTCHTECVPTHAGEWCRAHDERQSHSTYDHTMRLIHGTRHTLLQRHQQ